MPVAAAEQIADALADSGYCVIDSWLDENLHAALAREVREHAGTLRASLIGRGDGRRELAEVRSDRMQWIDEDCASNAVLVYLNAMDTLRQALNGLLYLGLRDYECHFSHYCEGAAYQRHRDRFRSDDARTLSTVYYLNEGWTPADGGVLRLHLPNTDGSVRALDIQPDGGRLMLFLSAEIEHEVCTTRRDRYSIAGWMRRTARPHASLTLKP